MNTAIFEENVSKEKRNTSRPRPNSWFAVSSSDEDFAFIYFIQSFGKKCYVDPEGLAVNCDWDGQTVVSRAPYPREYRNGADGYVITSSHLAAVIEQVAREAGGYAIALRNLRDDSPIETVICCEMADGASSSKTIVLQGAECRVVRLDRLSARSE
jgi:hypothetical protein